MLGDDQGDLVDGEEETEKKKEKLQMVGELGDFFFLLPNVLFFVLNVCKSFRNLSRKSPVANANVALHSSN